MGVPTVRATLALARTEEEKQSLDYLKWLGILVSRDRYALWVTSSSSEKVYEADTS